MRLTCKLQKKHHHSDNFMLVKLFFFLCGGQKHTGNLVSQTDFANRLAVNVKLLNKSFQEKTILGYSHRKRSHMQN